MNLRIFSKFFFIGLLQGVSISFLYLLPLLIYTHYFLLKNIFFSTEKFNSFFGGWFFGFGFFLGSMHWIISPFLIYERHFYLAPIIVLIFPISLGLFFSIYTILISNLKKILKIDNNFLFLKSFFISITFFFIELLRSKIFGGLPFNLTSHIWAFHDNFIAITKFIGVFGLSFLTINWIFLISSNLLLKKIKTSFVIFLTFPVFLIFLGKFESNREIVLSKQVASIRVVQPNIPQAEKWNKLFFQTNLDKLLNLTSKNNNPNINKLVIWPEVAITSYLNEDEELVSYINNRIPKNISLVSGSLRREFQGKNYKIYNSLYVITNEKIDFYDKKKLVPFGEYIPFRKLLSFSKLTSGTGDFNEGTIPSFMKLSFGDSFITFEPSICYEAVFQTFGFNSTNLFINITNDAWFGKTTGPRQHLAAQIFRSVEKGSPLIRSSNSGISVITNSNGKILKKINLNEAGFIEDQILLNNKETFFEKYKSNSLLVLLLFLIMIFYLIDLIFSSKRK